MDLIELETRASKGEPIPEHLTYEERTLYEQFQCLYFLLKNKQISVEQAKQEKQIYLSKYKQLHLIIQQYYRDTKNKAAIYDIINKYQGAKNMPPDTIEALCRMIDCCLIVEVTREQWTSI